MRRVKFNNEDRNFAAPREYVREHVRALHPPMRALFFLDLRHYYSATYCIVICYFPLLVYELPIYCWRAALYSIVLPQCNFIEYCGV